MARNRFFKRSPGARRVAWALVLAPPIAGIIIGLCFAALPWNTATFPERALVGGFMGLLVAVAGGGYLFTYALGLPLHMLLQKLKWTHLIYYVVAGAIGGLLAIVVLYAAMIFQNYSVGVGFNLDASLLIGPVYGATIATIAWLIRRPDRDANPSTDNP